MPEANLHLDRQVEFLEEYRSRSGFDERMRYLESLGARKLGDVTQDFLLESAWLNLRKNHGLKPPNMKTRDSKLKSDFLERMEKAILDLSYLQEPFLNGGAYGARFDGKDAMAILTKDRLVRLVSMALSIVPDGREYADAILRELYSFYAGKGEEVQIVRSFDPWASHRLLGLR
jgi:hypothetical protein